VHLGVAWFIVVALRPRDRVSMMPMPPTSG